MTENIRVFTQNSIRINGNGKTIYIDTFKMTEKPNDADYILVTHDHFDHSATQFVNLIPTEKILNIGYLIVPHDHHNGTKRGLNNLYLFNLSGMKVLHVGDLGCIPNQNILDLIAGVDVILAPINGFYTISAKELHEICEIIKPRIVIPVHYYRKEHNSGYPDGNQIDIFKQLFNQYIEVNDYRLEITKDKPQSGAIIFKEYYQGE